MQKKPRVLAGKNNYCNARKFTFSLSITISQRTYCNAFHGNHYTIISCIKVVNVLFVYLLYLELCCLSNEGRQVRVVSAIEN